MGTGAYRDAASAGAEPPATLSCWLRDGDKNAWIRTATVKLWLTAGCAAVVYGAGGDARPLAIVLACAGALWAGAEWRKRNGAEVSFVHAAGRLRIRRGAGSREIDLADLLDVRLDTRSAEKNLTQARADGVNSIFGMSSTHHIQVDQSRIELVIAGEAAPLTLDASYISHSLCTESLRTIRLFLRKHGWKPADERA